MSVLRRRSADIESPGGWCRTGHSGVLEMHHHVADASELHLYLILLHKDILEIPVKPFLQFRCSRIPQRHGAELIESSPILPGRNVDMAILPPGRRCLEHSCRKRECRRTIGWPRPTESSRIPLLRRQATTLHRICDNVPQAPRRNGECRLYPRIRRVREKAESRIPFVKSPVPGPISRVDTPDTPQSVPVISATPDICCLFLFFLKMCLYQ